MRLRPVASFLPCFVAAAFAFLALSGSASAQVATAFNSTRSTSAQADAVQRNASVIGFGKWTSNLQVASVPEASQADGNASQNSGLYDDHALADGEAQAGAVGEGHGAVGSSDYWVHFLVRARTGYTLTGHLEVSTGAGSAASGAASGSIEFSGPLGEVASLRLECRTGPEQTEGCTQVDDVLASGVLEPGIYVLRAQAHAEGQGGPAATRGQGQALYTVEIHFDGPIVDAEAATWSGMKSLFR